MVRGVLVAAAVMGAATARVPAEVIDSGDQGFTIRHVAIIAAPPPRVYQAAVESVARWWHPDHTFSGSSANLQIDGKPGGCFCERLPDGGGVMHLTVLSTAPGRSVRFTGGLGPFQQMAVAGAMGWALTEEAGPGHTRFEWTYSVGGYRPGGLSALAAPVDGVIGVQLQRLKRFVETGRPE